LSSRKQNISTRVTAFVSKSAKVGILWVCAFVCIYLCVCVWKKQHKTEISHKNMKTWKCFFDLSFHVSKEAKKTIKKKHFLFFETSHNIFILSKWYFIKYCIDKYLYFIKSY
jgi:hypothetical protein